MNRQTLAGLIGGVALATAGGVAAFTYAGRQAAGPEPAPSEAAQASESETVSQPAPAVTAAPTPTRTDAAPAPSRADAAPANAVEQRCWDEEVTVQAEPRDDKAIAGTAAGAVIGGAIAKNLGDDNDLLTAAGAAAGAFAGRKAQQRVQENNTTTRIERRCEPVDGG